MCNLYCATKPQSAIRDLAKAMAAFGLGAMGVVIGWSRRRRTTEATS
jgi:hypothetical protein